MEGGDKDRRGKLERKKKSQKWRYDKQIKEMGEEYETKKKYS
jgi:hypothetical protein